MKYNINEKFLFLPPFISTSWDQVKFIRVQNSAFLVEMNDGTSISIPELPNEVVESLFNAHAQFLQKQETARSEQVVEHAHIQIKPFRVGGDSNPVFEQFNTNMQHNPEMAQAPDFPTEVLNKIAAIAKVVAPNESVQLPKAEPHCNCPHCQIARAIHAGVDSEIHFEMIDPECVAETIENLVDDKDLSFEQWQIVAKGEQLYDVVNKLDPHEQYTVFLGEPVGCNCGKMGCEHILAVLKS